MASNPVHAIQDALGERRKAGVRAKAGRAKVASRKRAVRAKAVAVVAIACLLVALALVVGDADYKATAIGWTPLVAYILLVGLAYAYVRVLEHSLAFSEELFARDCKRGKEVPFTIHLANKSPLVFFRLEASFFVSDLFGNVANEAAITFALGPFETYDLAFQTKFEHIGTYTAGLEHIVISDFLGLFTRRIPSRGNHSVDVTPQLQPLEQISFDTTATVETSKAAKAVLADSMDYAHVREYVPGDPLKTIHWKLSARSDTYMTRLYEVYTDPGVGIIMDFYADSDDARMLMGMFDAVVESAFSIADYTRQKGMDTEVQFCDRHGEQRAAFAWGDNEMPGLIADMPRMSNDASDSSFAVDLLRKQVLDQHGKSTLVVCSASLDSELIATIVDAKARRRSPMLVCVIPSGIDGRALDDYCKPLAQLDAANIAYVVITRSEELGVTLR